jgi:hypothetical protein
MKNKASSDKTIISVDLNIRTIEWAKKLGLNLSEMADKLLKVEVKKRLKKIKTTKAKAEIPA